eukprot:GHVU01131379.1.p1 GENE.GHVU01131379.1~~GHVU01131379.1.p1  ORF type:complete len:129 (-),score=1.37 GHVU01131379.1:7-393(-)
MQADREGGRHATVLRREHHDRQSNQATRNASDSCNGVAGGSAVQRQRGGLCTVLKRGRQLLTYTTHTSNEGYVPSRVGRTVEVVEVSICTRGNAWRFPLAAPFLASARGRRSRSRVTATSSTLQVHLL